MDTDARLVDQHCSRTRQSFLLEVANLVVHESRIQSLIAKYADHVEATKKPCPDQMPVGKHVCASCQMEFECATHGNGRPVRRTCSKKCAHRLINANRGKGIMIRVVCRVCKDAFQTKQWTSPKSGNYHALTCGPWCRQRWRQRHKEIVA